MKKTNSITTILFILLFVLGTLQGGAASVHAQSVQTWSDPVNVSRSGGATNPSLVVDSKGVLHAFWVDEFDGFKYAESADGVTWTAPDVVKTAFNPKGLPPVMLADAVGRVHIFWINEKSALMYAQASEQSVGVPAAWRVTSTLDTFVFDFDAAVDAAGRVHVSYIKNPKPPSNDLSGAYYMLSLDGGLSWQPETLLYESPYFRSIDETKAHIRLAVSGEAEDENVYSVWDDLAQKRVYLGISRDGGKTWETVREIIAPDAALGFKTPFNADIDVLKGDLLLTWRVGEPGIRCALYSRVSADGGETWDAPIRVLSESAQCPEASEFISIDPEYSAMLLRVQTDLTMIVWNGLAWSNPENQSGPSSMINPATFQAVVLGCQKAVPFNGKLYVVGCDQGGGGDIWFISRELDPLENLFPLPSAWSLQKNLATVPQKVSPLVSVADAAGNIHSLWVQSAADEAEVYEPRFMYARWNGAEWSEPAPVITDLEGLPTHPSLTIDPQQRLLLTWADDANGDLLFSWANSARANITLEWSEPVVLPSASDYNTSPSIVVDAAERIVIAYAVPINENRGIYITQSTDLGVTWLPPLLAFDAIAAEWDRVDQPTLAFTDNGALHLLFTQYPARLDETSGNLYYSQSSNGGASWSQAESVSEHTVEWSHLLTAPQQVVHRFWQEKDKFVTSSFHQVSQDGGTTWSAADKISSIDSLTSVPSISLDWEGNVHLLQVTVDDLEYLNEWQWSANGWHLVETKKIAASTEDKVSEVGTGVTSNGELLAVLHTEFANAEDEPESQITSFHRALELAPAPEPFIALIAPLANLAEAATPEIGITATAESPLAGLEDGSAPLSRNTIGLILVILVVAVIVVTVIPRRKSKEQ